MLPMLLQIPSFEVDFKQFKQHMEHHGTNVSGGQRGQLTSHWAVPR